MVVQIDLNDLNRKISFWNSGYKSRSMRHQSKEKMLAN